MYSSLLQGVCLLILFVVRSRGDTDTTVEANNLRESVESNDELQLTTLQLVQKRGFHAINHNLTTTDGYILNIVRCTNPLINNGISGLSNRPLVLFVHGTVANGNLFILNSLGASPRDLSGLDVASLSEKELNEMFKNDPNKNSLPFLLLNAGSEVWILNRRGTSQSLGNVDANKQPYSSPSKQEQNGMCFSQEETRQKLAVGQVFNSYSQYLGDKINPKYWNVSLDSEILIDIPQTIDYILKVTGREKLDYVGHSSGAGILLAALSQFKELYQKVSNTLLWAPFIYSSQRPSNFLQVQSIPPGYIGPKPPTALISFLRDQLAIKCQNPEAQRTICSPDFDKTYGYGANQQRLLPGLVAGFMDTSTSQHLIQIKQVSEKGKLHRFDYGDPARNIIAYNAPEPPLYDLGNILYANLTIWVGSTDALVPTETAVRFINDLGVKPAKVVFLDQPGIFFNHNSFAWHQNISNLLNIPGFKTLLAPPMLGGARAQLGIGATILKLLG